MVVNILVQPEYRETVWCKETLRGIDERVSALRYKSVECDEDGLDSIQGGVIIVGTSPKWVSSALKKAQKVGLWSVVVSCRPMESFKNTSYVLMDHAGATRECIDYLAQCGKESLALFGVNEASYADITKATFFESKDVYFSQQDGGLCGCFENFEKNASGYDAVICTNYISAIFLAKKLKEKGISVPDDVYLVTYGDSVLGRFFKPSITTITLNHRELGIQSVEIYKYISRQGADKSVTLHIPCKIIPAESTNMTEPQIHINTESKSTYSEYEMEKDEWANRIQKLEKVLRCCEDGDFDILEALLEGRSYGSIAGEMFASENSVKYRVKRLLKNGDMESAAELLEIYKEYLDK